MSDGATGSAGAEVVRAAPGGGEMMIVGPEWRYVIRGSTDGEGHLHIGCGRDGRATGSPVSDPAAWSGAR